MNLFVWIGFVMLFMVMYFSAPDIFSQPKVFFQAESAIMVFGGIMALFFLSSTLEDVKGLLSALKTLFIKDKFPSDSEIVDKLVELSILSQRKGRMALEGAGKDFDDGFLENGLQFIVNKLQPDFIRVAMENELQETSSRHLKNAQSLRFLATVAPLCGMFGTVVGIVLVLQNMTDPKKIGPSMALALLTTMYGVFVAGFICSPLASRLERRDDAETLKKNIIIEGVIMIAKGEIPIKVETYLRGFLSNKTKEANKKDKKQEQST